MNSRVGEITICRDINQLNMMVQFHNNGAPLKVIVLDDKQIEMSGYIGGSILLPTLEALTFQIDNNDYINFRNVYLNYLFSDPDVDKFVTLLVTALYKGTDLLFFFGESDPSMFMDVLLEYLICRGIQCVPFEQKPMGSYIPAVSMINLPSWIDRMRGYEYISDQEYNSVFVQKDNSPFQTFIQ